MRVLFALPGLHKYDRGAERAFISVATELALAGDQVTLIGSGAPYKETPYRFLRALSLGRENFEKLPSLPVFRNECCYEEMTFIPGFLLRYRPNDYDVTLTCNYPFLNWMLARPTLRGARPPHVFVTQNGDWPAQSRNSEYRFFDCDGLICTNPEYYDRNKTRWNCALIPNGVDINQFTPGQSIVQAWHTQQSSNRVDGKRFDTGQSALMSALKRLVAFQCSSYCSWRRPHAKSHRY